MAESIGKQISKAIRIIGIGFLTFLLMFMLIDGIARVASVVRGGPSKVIGIAGAVGVAELVIAGWILFLTTNMWSQWVAPASILGAVKSGIGLIAGTTASLPFRPVARVVAGETLLYFLAVGLLAVKYTSKPPKLPERIALVAVVFATSVDMLFEPQPLVLAVGVGFLLLSRLAAATSKPNTAAAV